MGYFWQWDIVMINVSQLGTVAAAGSSGGAPVNNVGVFTFNISLYQNKIADIWGYDRRLGDDPITNPLDSRYGQYNNWYQTQTETFGEVDNEYVLIRGTQYRITSFEHSAIAAVKLQLHDPNGDLLPTDIVSIEHGGTTTTSFTHSNFQGGWNIDFDENGVNDFSGAAGNYNTVYGWGGSTQWWNNATIDGENLVIIRTAI